MCQEMKAGCVQQVLNTYYKGELGVVQESRGLAGCFDSSLSLDAC